MKVKMLLKFVLNCKLFLFSLFHLRDTCLSDIYYTKNSVTLPSGITRARLIL